MHYKVQFSKGFQMYMKHSFQWMENGHRSGSGPTAQNLVGQMELSRDSDHVQVDLEEVHVTVFQNRKEIVTMILVAQV